MEFLNPQAERRRRILLFVGYGLVAIVIALVAQLLLYRLYNGYTVDMQGNVQQSGVVFVSSSPSGASIYLNGVVKAETNARLSLNSGDYSLRITANGYRDWQHEVTVNGADVQRFTYPKLFPTTLTTTTVRTLDNEPQFVSQSPNRRWLLIKDTTPAGFLLYDLRRPAAPVATELGIVLGTTATAGDGAHSWSVVEWASDDQYVLLNHTYTIGETTAHEYILLDRSAVENSKNLTHALVLTADEELTLFDKKYDQYYSYNRQSQVLRAFDSSGKQLADQLEHIRAYKTYGDATVLYVTDLPESGKQETGTVNLVLRQGSRRQVLRRLPESAPAYLLDISRFNGTWLIAAGVTNGTGVYIYKNPLSQSLTGTKLPQAWRFLRVQNPTSLSTSTNAQFVLVSNGQTCAVYDADAVETKNFSLVAPLDAPQMKPQWMDGHRLQYVSGGKVVVVEYDNHNAVDLQPAVPQFGAFYSADYKYAFALAAGDGTARHLTATALTVEE